MLLPGMDGTGQMFNAFIAALNPAAPARIMHYPPDLPQNYEQLTQRVQAALPPTDPFVVIAESFSGPIAITLAARRPPNLAGLVLVSTFARSPVRIPRWMRPMLARLPRAVMTMSTPLRYALGSDATPALLAEFQQANATVSSSAWRSRIRALLEVDVTSACGGIQVPVLCLTPSNDRVVTRSAAESLINSHPAWKHIRIEGPHFLLQTRAAACATAMRSWAAANDLIL